MFRIAFDFFFASRNDITAFRTLAIVISFKEVAGRTSIVRSELNESNVSNDRIRTLLRATLTHHLQSRGSNVAVFCGVAYSIFTGLFLSVFLRTVYSGV
jgi:hypothetical protein